MVDLNLDELYAKQLSPIDVSNALTLQNLILPAGTAKLADTEYQIKVNSSPLVVDELNNLPIKTVNGATVSIKDVAQVRDGYSVQSNIVRTNGARGVLMTVSRTGKASTLDIVNAVNTALPKILANLPQELKVAALADHFRTRFYSGCAARSFDCGGSHRHHDPAVPRELAQHVDRVHFDSPVYSDFPFDPEPSRANNQRNDARRSRARGRYSRRRRDSGD